MGINLNMFVWAIVICYGLSILFCPIGAHKVYKSWVHALGWGVAGLILGPVAIVALLMLNKYTNGKDTKPKDLLWFFLSLILPIVGIVLYVMWKEPKKKNDSSEGATRKVSTETLERYRLSKYILAGFIAGIIGWIIIAFEAVILYFSFIPFDKQDPSTYPPFIKWLKDLGNSATE